MSGEDKCSLDNEGVEEQKLFVDAPSSGSLGTTNMFSSLYLEGFWKGYICWKTSFQKGEPYSKRKYLYLTWSHGPRLQFQIGTGPNDKQVVFPPDELLSHLCKPFMIKACRNEYKALLMRAQMYCWLANDSRIFVIKIFFSNYLLFWHFYFQDKKWYTVDLIKRCNKWQIFSSQTFTQDKL